ncbi:MULTISPECIES: hypothetical protein [unclassified Streptomyces]|nr:MULTISPECIES: hypothetical protein [unclassified Streptomyces]MBT2405747.1 hypothetical protein [Streptomyces sp. ISL-21]MBT2610357.1 hypothetical protein [Streptomyces sp. ISL-87]
MLHFIGLVLVLLVRCLVPPTWWRRQVLVLATYGVDVGPRVIHGRAVAR